MHGFGAFVKNFPLETLRRYCSLQKYPAVRYYYDFCHFYNLCTYEYMYIFIDCPIQAGRSCSDTQKR